ncbi:MAG: GDP-L-fucose synthase [Chitinophagaceae bacterium]|nr:GDP-L-fucose synthase [Chitinophagaceae bacterium]
MNRSDKIYVAGHNGMVGSSIVRKLKAEGFTNIIGRASKELDLRNQQAVKQFYSSEKPDYVFLAAAKVGGIISNNTYRAEFLYNNLMIEANIVHSSYEHNVKKLFFLGSSCIYPRMAPQPLREEFLLTGALEPTNEPYAVAKIAGVKLCEAYRDQYGCNFISVMPTNLYGPNDNYHPENSHVLPALMRKFHEAKNTNTPSVTVWGTGFARREFLHTDDFADACFYLMQNYDEKEFVNIGCGQDVSIKDLAYLLKRVTGYPGEIYFDHEKPDGTPRKLMDTSKLTALGWTPKIKLEEGVTKVYEEFKKIF